MHGGSADDTCDVTQTITARHFIATSMLFVQTDTRNIDGVDVMMVDSSSRMVLHAVRCLLYDARADRHDTWSPLMKDTLCSAEAKAKRADARKAKPFDGRMRTDDALVAQPTTKPNHMPARKKAAPTTFAHPSVSATASAPPICDVETHDGDVVDTTGRVDDSETEAFADAFRVNFDCYDAARDETEHMNESDVDEIAVTYADVHVQNGALDETFAAVGAAELPGDDDPQAVVAISKEVHAYLGDELGVDIAFFY